MRMFFVGVDNSTVLVFAGLDNRTAFVFAGLDNTTAFGWVFPKLFLPLSLSISQDICPTCVSLIINNFRSHSIFYFFLDFTCLSIYRIHICPELFVCLSIYKKAETCSHTHAHAHAHTYTHTNHTRYTPSVVLICSPAQSHRFSKILGRNQSWVLMVYTYYHKISNFS